MKQKLKKVTFSDLLEGIYTRCKNPFVIEIGVPDENGTVIYTRKNSEDGATVIIINTEFKLNPLKAFSLTSGFTMQKSKYDVAQEFDEKQFFRTPDQYGYFSLDWDFIDNVSVSATGNYTGSMLVPYFGTKTDPGVGELHKSEKFFYLGLKLKYTLKLNGLNLQFYGGIKNIFNSWQSNLDKGADRDPAYFYGPVNPRTIYFGINSGNALNK